MRRHAFRLGVILPALLIGCVSSQSAQPPLALAGWGFTMSLPAGVGVSRCRPLEDFEEYEFRVKDRVIARAEAGFNPSFRLANDEKPRRATVAGLDAIEVERRSGTRRVYEVIFALRTSGWDLPRALHVWSDVEGLEDERLVIALVSSVALAEGPPVAVSSCPGP